MSFYGKSFMYAGKSSEEYNLEIANIDGGGVTSNSSSGQVEIIKQMIFRRPRPYFYGVYYSDSLVFPVSFFSPDEITAVDASQISAWLFGNLDYKDLAIIQPDMDSFYIRCIFSNPQAIRAGNVIVGFNCDCICDSQFAYEYEKTKTYTLTPGSGSTINFYNFSDYPGYLYPTIDFTISGSGTGNYFSIINTSDSNRTFTFAGLSGSEVITVNNDLCIITSSYGNNRLSSFNKNFFRFIPGVNTLTVTGNASELNITYQFLKRIGG